MILETSGRFAQVMKSLKLSHQTALGISTVRFALNNMACFEDQGISFFWPGSCNEMSLRPQFL